MRRHYDRWSVRGSHDLSLFLLGMVLSAPLQAQLYLMTGSPTQKYDQGFGSSIFAVATDGTVTKTIDVAPGGTEWIGVSYEAGMAVILPQSPPDRRIVVVDIGTMKVVKRCEHPVPGVSLIDQWLAVIPDKGLTFVKYLSGNDPMKAQTLGMITDPEIGCDRSFVPLDLSEVKFVVAQGRAGVADVSVPDGIRVNLDQEGRVMRWLAGVTTYLGYSIPPSFREGLSSRPNVALLVNNSRVAVFALAEEGIGRAVVFRKRDGAWRQIPDSGDRPFWVRGFGNILSIAEARRRSDHNRASAGATEWRKRTGAMGPSVEGRLRDSSDVFSGRLHLYDVDTERMYTITTNQGDSEVLLVDNNVVYYRASDRLYTLGITEKGLTPARLIATSEVVRDSHWAFIAH